MSFLHFLAKFKNIFTISCMSPTLFSSFNGINSLPSHKHNLKIHLFPWAILNSFWPHKTYFNSSILPFLIFSGISFFYYLSHLVLFFSFFWLLLLPIQILNLIFFPSITYKLGLVHTEILLPVILHIHVTYYPMRKLWWVLLFTKK